MEIQQTLSNVVGPGVTLPRISMRRPQITFNSFHDTVYGDSTKVSQCKGTMGHIMFNTHEETKGSLKSFHDTVCGDSTKLPNVRGPESP